MDIDELRRDTPGCEHVLHLDYAGASLPPTCVFEAIREHMELEERWGGYRAADHVRDRVEGVYDDIARLVGADRDEIALMDSATRAWQHAFSAVKFRRGDRVLCSRVEYASNYLGFLRARQRLGIEVVPIPADDDGLIDLDRLELELELGAALVALTHVPTNGGAVQPAAQVAELCRDADVPLLLDACQSAGQVDLREVKWDFLSATGRKYLRGPRGTGFLAVRREWLERLAVPWVDLHGARWTAPNEFEVEPTARRFELWERNVGDVLGLGAAVRYALDCGVVELEDRIGEIAAKLRARLAEEPGVELRDRGSVRCGIVTFTVDGADPSELKARLRERDVHVSVSQRSSTLLDMSDRGLDRVLRASVHALTTEAELDAFVEHLRAVRRG